MTLRYLSGSNGFVPAPTGQVIAFVRDVKKFKINQYVQYIPTPKSVGVYAVLDRDHPVRIVSDADFAWADGDDRPMGKANVGRFQWAEFATQRRDYPFTLGWKAQEQAEGSWKPFAYEAAAHASQAMTNRTQRVWTYLESTGNWGTHYADANTLNGGAGLWEDASDDPNDPAYNAIRKTLLEAMRRIFLDTNSMVNWEDMRLVMNPDCAIAMASSAEFMNYLKQSPFAMAQVKGDVPNINQTWGLPEKYCGLNLVVEDGTIVTERPKASGTEASTSGTPAPRRFIKGKTSAAILSRPGGMDGDYGSPSWSTVQVYHYNGLLQVEAFDDPENRRTKGHVSEDFKEVVPATQAGFLITNVVSA